MYTMKSTIISLAFFFVSIAAFSQPKHAAKNLIAAAAQTFLQSLTAEQKAKAQFAFDAEERYTWHYIPKDDRKGITIGELSEPQKKAALDLLRSCMSDDGYTKATSIIQLE